MAPDLLFGVHPDVVARITRVLTTMATLGHPMRVCQGLRTADQQHVLWLQGRLGGPPGPRVTNCDGVVKRSRHQAAADGLGHAVDCCFLGLDPFGIKQPWARYGAAVKAEGLFWGGDFKLLPADLDHAELP